MPSRPVIIEAAINGANPDAPRSPESIAATARECFDAGAAIVHNHIDLVGDAATVAARYREGWDPVLDERPDALLYPTINGVGDHETRFCHIAPLAESGVLRIGIIDPGSVNLGPRFAYVNAGDSIEHQRSLCERFELGPTIAIFEAGFLRAALSLWRAGRLPGGAMIRLYFGGAVAEADGDYWFGLPPTEPSLEAYLAMLDGCPIPWSVAVLGGDLFDSDLPRYAVELGGHLRVGLEDYAGDAAKTNEELVVQAVDAVLSAGFDVASAAETTEILGLRPAVPAGATP
jgi:3-keto-5-aminohexanoate cleavage enzyme